MPTASLYDIDLAVERIRAARRAIDDDGTGVLLVARSEAFLVGHPDPLREAVEADRTLRRGRRRLPLRRPT